MIGDANAKKYFYHTDQVGSVRAVTDDVGKVVWKADYLAFGTQFEKDKLDPSFEEDEFAFTGKGFDGDTGLYYYNARWYDSETGRFMSEDPVRDPNNPNLYSMGRNNPLRFTDPTGCISQEDAMSEHARNSSSSPSYDWSGNYSYSGGPSNKGSSPKIEPGSFKRTNEEGRPVWDMGYYVDGVFVPNQNNGSMSFFIEYWINTFKDQAKKLGISARFTEGFVCGALDDICTFAMMYSKTNLLNPINVFNLIVGSYNFAKSGLNLIGAINKSDKTEITEFLNSIKQSLGDEFVKPFTDVFNDLKNGISADNAFEFGRSAYKSVMTILIVAAAGKAAIKGGTALAKAFNKGAKAAEGFVFDLQFSALQDRGMIKAVAKDYKIDAKAFGDFVEEYKQFNLIRNDATLNWKKLEKLAQQFIENGGQY